MREKPIIFFSEMIQAILTGRKTQTRRVINPQPIPWAKASKCLEWRGSNKIAVYASADGMIADCPYGQPGDQLWVRETYKFGHAPNDDRGQGIAMYADGDYKLHPDLPTDRATWCREWKKKLSIFMPRWASRINLLIKNVRVERLQEISEADAKAEGVTAWHDTINGTVYTPEFKALWDTINAKRGYPWASNPWVWVIEFDRLPD